MHTCRLPIRTATFAAAAVLVAFAVAHVSAVEAPNDVVQLPRFEVREKKGLSDFGMSVVTNFGVLWGGKIKWLRVGVVAPGSPAALAGLNTDDEIFRIDDEIVAQLRRAAMLRYFFGRPPEARIRLLVRSAQTRQLRWIELRSLRALNAP